VKSLLRTTGEILKFEVVCKLLTICLVYPVLGGVYRIYAASEGLNFNSGAAFAFVSPAGVVVLLLVAAAATAFVFWELSTVIRIAALTRQGQDFTWRELWWGSLWSLGALRGWSLPVSGVFYLALLPLAGFGYVNSLIPTLSIPEFIYSELRRYDVLGRAALIAIPTILYLLALLFLFVPLFMALRRERLFSAAKGSLKVWRRAFWRNGRLDWRGPAVVGAIVLWLGVFTRIAQYWRRNRLGLVDFDAAFFRNLLYSEAFPIDLAYWVVRALLDTVAMALFVRLLLAVMDPQRDGPCLAGRCRPVGRNPPQAAWMPGPKTSGPVETVGSADRGPSALPGGGRLDVCGERPAGSCPPSGSDWPQGLHLRDGEHACRLSGRG